MSDELLDALGAVFGEENVIVFDEKGPHRMSDFSEAGIEKDLREEHGDQPWIKEMASLMWQAGITMRDNPDDYEELLRIMTGEDDG
jgi:hypothetical protein